MLLVIGVVVGAASLHGGSDVRDRELVLFTVVPRDLPISVIERGTLSSQKDVQVICQVDDVQGDGIYGTPILWIVENGSSVEEGDLVVELDSASHLERLDQQILETERARARYTQVRLFYENQITRNETASANAKLDLMVSQLELQQYEDEQGGTFQIELQEVEMGIQQHQARQDIDDRNLVGIEHLYDLGYKSKGDLAQARLQALRAKGALNREISRRRELLDYSYARSRLVLEGANDSAERALIQVERDNDAMLAQAKARMDSAEASLEREEERLARYKEQVANCKLYAPQSGMVAYHVEASRWGGSSSIAEGMAIRDRQPILSIPSLRYMQVKTAVHESTVDRVKMGMPVTVRLDAFPDRQYDGTISSVAVLPDPGGWLSSDTKVYTTIISIDQELDPDVDRLKPGMTAVAEIHIDYLDKVLCVPTQALVQRGDSTWCYVVRKGMPTRCQVVVGDTNDKFVEIRSGLTRGDQVVLNPSAILGDLDAGPSEIASDKKKEAAAPLQ